MTIDEYLDELLARLRGRPAVVRRMLVESEAHLRDAADTEIAAGASPQEAEARAVARFGPPASVARSANAGTLGLVGPLAAMAARLAAVGFAAIAAAALAARVLALVTSTGFVFGMPASVERPPAADHWLSVQPTAHDWRTAAALENADDTLVLRVAFALLGLVAALILMAATRRWRALPSAVPAIGMATFGAVGIGLLAGGLANAYTPFEWGRGLWLVDASVALVVAAFFALGFLREVRHRVG